MKSYRNLEKEQNSLEFYQSKGLVDWSLDEPMSVFICSRVVVKYSYLDLYF